MNKPESNKRLLWFAVLVFLLASAKIGYAAVPQSTVRTTGGGITTYVGNFVNATSGYFMGANEIISATRAATFITLDTGQGANELYDMDQNVLQASSPSFVGITLTGDLLNTYNITQTLQYPELPVSSIIWQESGTYYAKNGTTGEVTFNSDFDVLANQVLSVMNGGILVIKEGSYTADNSLDISNSGPITIMGHGDGDGSSGTRLFMTSTTDPLILNNNTSSHLHITIENLRLRGPNSGTGNGIYLRYARFATVRNVMIERFGGAGIYCSNVMQSMFQGNRIISNTNGMVLTNNVDDGLRSNWNFVYQNAFLSNSENGLIIDESQGNIVDSDFETNYNGVNITGANSVFNDISGWFEGNTNYGITIESGIRNKLEPTVYSGNGNGNTIDAPTQTFYGDSPNFRTQNRNFVTITNGSTTKWVEHGVVILPNLGDISCVPWEDLGLASQWWISDVNETHFRINLNADPGENISFGWGVYIHGS